MGSAKNLSKERTQLYWLQDGKLLGSEKVEGEAGNVASYRVGW